MIEPLFWLGLLSILLATVSLIVVLVVALPTYRELARAARSAEKLFDTLSRELPPTLEAIRLTGLEISDLTDDVNDGVQSARNLVKQVDQSIDQTKQQVTAVNVTTRSVLTGVKIAWKTLLYPQERDRRSRGVSVSKSTPAGNRKPSSRGSDRSNNYLPQSKQVATDFPKVKPSRRVSPSPEARRDANYSPQKQNVDSGMSQNAFNEPASDEPSSVDPD